MLHVVQCHFLKLCQICMQVEHAFAALKGRFQSLRELRLRMRTQQDLHIAVYWITYCMILHNMIVRFEAKQLGEGSMRWAIGEADWEDKNDDIGGELEGEMPGQQFRGLLMERLFEQCGIPI